MSCNAQAAAISKLLYCFASVWGIINLLKLMDYHPIQMYKPYSNLHLYHGLAKFSVQMEDALSHITHYEGRAKKLTTVGDLPNQEVTTCSITSQQVCFSTVSSLQAAKIDEHI